MCTEKTQKQLCATLNFSFCYLTDSLLFFYLYFFCVLHASTMKINMRIGIAYSKRMQMENLSYGIRGL